MSLINEALKKAQRQRTEEAAPTPSPAADGTAAVPVARIAKHRPAMPARTLVVLIGGGASLLIMAGVFVFVFFFGDSPEPAAPAKPVVAAVTPVVATPVPVPPPVTPAPETVAPAPPVVSVQLPPVVTPAPTAETAPVPVVVAPPVTTPAPVVVTTPRPREPVGNPAIYEFLEKLRVSGVRSSATDPKVIMNDRVFRLNDIVDKTTQLRLVRVDNFTLYFSDPSGFEYRKTL